ncbi:DUF6777 domain-containing protein [Streptomyces sp. NPDC093094]|uniref:DUF6777 domain-containing protein n=1 Tax=Streptomyces sp. NPDC093094 TaxID=3366026 RepID=UPI00382119AE
MSVEPPSSGRPTGPPSGPLSGPGQPPSGPPSQPPTSGGGATPPPRRPWWRSAPRVALVSAAVVAAVVLAVVLTRPGGGSAPGSGGEVFLQAAGTSGPDPFTESTADDSSLPPVTPSPAGTSPANTVRGVDGGAPGLYGGTRNVAACDVEKQAEYLTADPAKNKAFASVASVEPAGVPAYLRSLTPVQLRIDTRVTNHGYSDGAATGYQAVLQSGTAVLVDDRGVPRVRCACGNPLTPPVAVQGTPQPTGASWPSYRSSNVVVVNPAPVVIDVFVIYDAEQDEWIERHQGDTGDHDRKTDRPSGTPTPSVSVSTPTSSSTSPSTPSTSPSSPSPSSPSPSSQSPSSEPPTSAPEPEPQSQSPDTSSPQEASDSGTTVEETVSDSGGTTTDGMPSGPGSVSSGAPRSAVTLSGL